MPVSTRSQISTNPDENKRKQEMDTSHRNPHYGLKEKMKALTQLYEQQKKETLAKNRVLPRFSTHPSVDLVNSAKREDKNVARKCFLEEESKENVENGGENILGFTCDRKGEVARRLSMAPQTEPVMRTRIEQENAKNGVIGYGSRIMVYVRLRPMAKKEREGGARCCVRIVNKRDIYLTEFATEKDYLRLKRLRGRHFMFDASFTDGTSQQEVYSTT